MPDTMDEEFVPHSLKQEQLIFSEEPLQIAGTGTQWGKSQAGSLWFKRQTHIFTEKTDNFLLLAPSYKIMQQSMLPYFLYTMEGHGEYKKADGEFKINGGGTVYLRTGTDPDSIVGVPNVRAYWLDEGGKARLYFWENIQARAASKGARGLITTSPYARNWLYKQYIKPISRGEMKDVPYIKAASWENPYHSLHDEKKRMAMRSQMDPRRFDMIFGGEWGQMVGLVYDCWDDAQNTVEPFQLPTGTKYYGGIDWGYYPDPFALVVRAITPDGRHYGVSEFGQTQLTITDIVKIVRQKKEAYGITRFFCDPSQPGYIEELNRAGIPAQGADNDIRRGIDLHYELIKTVKYKEFIGSCPHSADEREIYHYPEPKDLQPDQGSKELSPVDKDNHFMDANRYVTIETYRSQLKITPKSPSDQIKPKEHTDRLAFLKRHKRSSHSENWG